MKRFINYIPTGKRLLDVSTCTVCLAMLAVPLAIVAFAIKLTSHGPVFYSQRRIGQHERAFQLLKFRTMHKGADQSSSVTVASDSRITRLGSILRNYKIDELPQIFNVLRGDMSLVGPRPTVLDDVLKMNSTQKGRFDAVPGMTGLAQISGNTNLFWEDRIEYDLDYIERRSLGLDLQIIAKTIALILSSKVASNPAGDSEWRN